MLFPSRISLFTAVIAIVLSGCTSVHERTVTPPHSLVIATTTTFTDVDKEVKTLNARYSADRVLIVSDIDNTLLTSTADLGGDIWYQWQTGKLAVKPRDSEQVSCLFEDTIGLLYELNPMTPTEPGLANTISTWQSQGNTIFALTSRAPKYRAATERELLRNGFDMSVSALTPENQQNPNYREHTERELSYSRGVMMTTGMNKGHMLKWILDKTQRQFDAIVFIDDSRKNIDNLAAAWRKSDIDVRLFYYTRVEEDRAHKFGAVLTEDQASAMAEDYQQLITTLEAVFPARKSQTCLSVN
nr:DUF2608 domain-containing protein [Aestuariibacter sp. A3R04]